MRFISDKALMLDLFIYLKALPNVVGHPQQPKANYNGPSKIIYNP